MLFVLYGKMLLYVKTLLLLISTYLGSVDGTIVMEFYSLKKMNVQTFAELSLLKKKGDYSQAKPRLMMARQN